MDEVHNISATIARRGKTFERNAIPQHTKQARRRLCRRISRTALAVHLFVRQGGGRGSPPRSGAVSGRRSLGAATSMARTCSARCPVEQDERHRAGAAARGGQGAQGAPNFRGQRQRRGGGGVPLSRRLPTAREEFRRKAPLPLGKGEACGETAPAPYWVGAGAAAPKQVKRGNSFADETQQGRRLTPTTAATTFGGSLAHLLKSGFGCPLDPFFLRGASQGLHIFGEAVRLELH